MVEVASYTNVRALELERQNNAQCIRQCVSRLQAQRQLSQVVVHTFQSQPFSLRFSCTTESAQAGKSFLLTLTYPSQHVLLIKLLVTPCAPIKLVSAEVRPIHLYAYTYICI